MEIENTSNWNNIPNVVLDHIFSYLPWPDKLSASSTCKQWRCGLYHPCFWKSISFSLTALTDDKIAKEKYFIHAFGKIVKFVNINFNSSDRISSDLTDTLLCSLHNNTQLKKLMLIPSHCELTSLPPIDCSRMCHHIFTILTKTNKLEELSIGCLDDVAMYTNVFLKIISDRHSKSVRVLGIATLKLDPTEYILNPFESQYLKNFSNLQVLSMNYDYVNDQFLESLHNCVLLKRIIFHLHSNVENHPSTTENAWIELKKYCPLIELRLNIIHAVQTVLKLHTDVLRKAMPLTHLRVFFCGELNFMALNSLHIYRNTLKSLWWVDSPLYCDRDVLTTFITGMNPFIFAAWRCINLEEIILIGYKYFADDLRAITRLRGKELKRLDVLRDQMIESFHDANIPLHITCRDLEQEVSKSMEKPWKTLRKQQVHPVIFSPYEYGTDEYLIPILCNDLES